MDRQGRTLAAAFVIASCAVVSLSSRAFANGTIQFATPLRMPIPGSEFADMDGEGGPDALSTSGADVIVRLNSGGPSFGDPVAVAMAPSGEVAAFVFEDLDGDGRRDLAATTTAGQLVVRRSLGWPSFTGAITLPLAFPGNGLLAADLDGDDRPDLVVNHSDSGRVSVHRNLGAGAFGAAGVFPSVASSEWYSRNPHSLVAGHFDGNGSLDLAVVGHGNERFVAALLNQGNGALGAPILSATSAGGQVHVAIGDLDGDGLDDLAIGADAACNVLRANGDGTFAPLDSVRAFPGQTPRPLIADLNTDGVPELVAFSRANTQAYYGASFVLVRSGYGTGFVHTEEYLTASLPLDLAVTDLDRDGDLDVMAMTRLNEGENDRTSPDPIARVYRNRGDGLLEGYRNFTCPPPCDAYFTPVWDAGRTTLQAPADLFRNHEGRVEWWRNQGNGVFGALLDLGEGTLARLIDLNHDGRDDLVFGDANAVSIRLSIADGQWAATIPYEGGVLLGFADFDGDGEIDVAQLDVTRRMWIRAGSAAGNFGPASMTDAVIPAFAFTDLGDLDGDGRAEVVVCPSSTHDDTVHVLSFSGGGSVVTLARIEWPCVPPESSYPCRNPKPTVSPATRNHPGHLFLEAAYGDYPTIFRSYRCTPDGEFLLATEIQPTREAQGITLADFDLDGILDVALTLGADFDNGNVVVYHCDVQGALTESWSAYPGAYPRRAVARDFDGDSKPDLLIGRYPVGRLAIFTNTTETDEPTAALLTLVQAEATPQGIALDWFGAGAAGSASLERRTPHAPWSPLARLNADGAGHFRFDDRNVTPGERYGYRLTRAGEALTEETWIDVPSGSLAWLGIAPNPIVEEGFARFTLGREAAIGVEVLDVTGRRLASLPAKRLAAGTHALRLPTPPGAAPGIYLMRLSAGSEVVTRRFALMR